MSATVDTNILLYAANADDESHQVARDLLERLARGPDLLYLFRPTIVEYLRISTHPAIFTDPQTPAQAADAITGLLQRPNVRAPSEQDGFWDVYRTPPTTKPATTTCPTRTSPPCCASTASTSSTPATETCAATR